MTNDWAYDIESKVFSIIKGKTQSAVKKKFPTAVYTTSDASDSTAVFPSIYISELESPEKGFTTECGEIQSITATFEIKVTVNTKREDAKWIIKKICDCTKGMKFHMTMFPLTTQSLGTYTSIARVRRTISSDDEL